METSTFNILSGLSKPIQNFDPIGSYNQGRKMREEWDQSGRLNELRQKLPSMIQNIRTKFPELGEKLDSLAEVAKVDPMGAYKMLVELSDGNQANRDNVTIAKWREVALNAKNDGYNILGEAQQAPKETLSELSNKYLNAYKSYNSAISEMQKAGSTDTGVGQLGAMKPFSQAMQEYEKDRTNFERVKTEAETAKLQQQIVSGNLQGQGVQQAKTQQELTNAKLEAQNKKEEIAKKQNEKQGFSQDNLKKTRTNLASGMGKLLFPSEYTNLLNDAKMALKSADAYTMAKYLGAVIEPSSAVMEGEVAGWTYGGMSSTPDQLLTKFGFNKNTSPSKIFNTLVGQVQSKQASAINYLKNSIPNKNINPYGFSMKDFDPSFSGMASASTAPITDVKTDTPQPNTPPKNGVIRVGEYYVKYENGIAVQKMPVAKAKERAKK